MAVEIIIFPVNLHQKKILSLLHFHLNLSACIRHLIDLLPYPERAKNPIPFSIRKTDYPPLTLLTVKNTSKKGIQIGFIRIPPISEQNMSQIDRKYLAVILHILDAHNSFRELRLYCSLPFRKFPQSFVYPLTNNSFFPSFDLFWMQKPTAITTLCVIIVCRSQINIPLRSARNQTFVFYTPCTFPGCNQHLTSLENIKN